MTRALRNALSIRKVALLVTLAAASACTLNTDVSQPAALVKVGGDLQSGPTNTTFPTPLSVIVATQFGEVVPGATVTWTITSGGGTLSATTTPTDDNGTASVTYTAGATAGPVVIQSRVGGVPPLTFNLTVT